MSFGHSFKEIGEAVRQMNKFMNEQISIRKQMVSTGHVMENPDAFTMMVQANEQEDTKYVLENDELVCIWLFRDRRPLAHGAA
jgi:uncharacterized protein (UPF0332 family)